MSGLRLGSWSKLNGGFPSPLIESASNNRQISQKIHLQASIEISASCSGKRLGDWLQDRIDLGAEDLLLHRCSFIKTQLNDSVERPFDDWLPPIELHGHRISDASITWKKPFNYRLPKTNSIIPSPLQQSLVSNIFLKKKKIYISFHPSIHPSIHPGED